MNPSLPSAPKHPGSNAPEPHPPASPTRRKVQTALAAGLGLMGAQGCATRASPAVAPIPSATAVPHSVGTAIPSFEMPALACDCHHHIYDRRFPAHPSATLLPEDASVEDYRLLQKRLGLQRNVIVQPSTYGTDNRLLVSALKAFGPSARGVGVVSANVSDAELNALHAAGVRGIRFNLSFLVEISEAMMEPLARRIAPMGWHLQINGTGDRLMPLAATLRRLACPIVFDHMGQLPQPQGIRHPAFGLYKDLIADGKAWFKLSGAYLTAKTPDYADVAQVAQALAQLAPQRLVWGSDWPHPTKKPGEKPDDAQLLNLLKEWFPAEQRRKILVDNPAALYGF